MKTRSKTFILLVFIFFITLVSAEDMMAQCAMCKASVETNVNEDGAGFASKLNFGILYLFAIPYLAAMVIGYSWYKKSQAHKQDLENAEISMHRIKHL